MDPFHNYDAWKLDSPPEVDCYGSVSAEIEIESGEYSYLVFLDEIVFESSEIASFSVDEIIKRDEDDNSAILTRSEIDSKGVQTMIDDYLSENVDKIIEENVDRLEWRNS